ncbi:MAG TPA: PfkB family carbohydrate kinase, partial [Caproiciproducens sp.]|nr:PfkB family carbohydrate kinase [Caproiciproducens sp.]
LTGERDLCSGACVIQRLGASLVLVTLGANGAYYKLGKLSGTLPTYDVKAIDTNGAGDAFTGAVHYCLRGKTLAEIQKFTKTDMENMISFANAVGSLTTTKSGAIPAMPTLKEVEDCRRTVPILNR